MPKGTRNSKLQPMIGGAKAITDRVNTISERIDDYDDRINDLEKAHPDYGNTIVVVNGIIHYADVPMLIKAQAD